MNLPRSKCEYFFRSMRNFFFHHNSYWISPVTPLLPYTSLQKRRNFFSMFSVNVSIKLLSLIFTAAHGVPGRINDRELVTSIWANKTSACYAIPFPLSWTFHQMSSYWVTRCFAVRRCYELAKTEGRMYFAVQFYGECWVSDDKNFMKYGQATNCWEGTGEHWAHYVYKIRE